MASGNKSTVFIFKWRVFNSCLVVSKKKGSMQRHPDSSGLESGGASSRLVNNTTQAGSSRLKSLGGSGPPDCAWVSCQLKSDRVSSWTPVRVCSGHQDAFACPSISFEAHHKVTCHGLRTSRVSKAAPRDLLLWCSGGGSGGRWGWREVLVLVTTAVIVVVVDPVYLHVNCCARRSSCLPMATISITLGHRSSLKTRHGNSLLHTATSNYHSRCSVQWKGVLIRSKSVYGVTLGSRKTNDFFPRIEIYGSLCFLSLPSSQQYKFRNCDNDKPIQDCSLPEYRYDHPWQ